MMRAKRQNRKMELLEPQEIMFELQDINWIYDWI